MENGEIFSEIKSARDLRIKILSDKGRPGYHFAFPEDIGIPGDPNGAFYANGRYHLMYLYRNTTDGFRWGHVSSIDMIHFRYHPDILIPDELDAGIFSGGAYVDDDGTAYIAYWSIGNDNRNAVKNNAGKGFGGIRIAKSNDIENHYEKWEKYKDFAFTCTASGVTEREGVEGLDKYMACADPSNIWKKGNYYYMQLGNLNVMSYLRDQHNAPSEYLGDYVHLVRSKDTVNWEYVGKFYQRRTDNQWTKENEDDMCPSFLPLPLSKDGGKMSDKYLQLFIAHNRGSQYYIGTYKEEKDIFVPEIHGRMSWVDNTYFAPEALITPDGRQVIWAWLTDGRKDETNRFGWCGTYSLPRCVWLNEDGQLGIAPIDELKTLRYNKTDDLRKIDRISCELDLTYFNSDAGKAEIIVRKSDDGSEYTKIFYDESAKELCIDTEKSGPEGRRHIERAPFELKCGEDMKLKIFVDKSVIEVFANDRQALVRHIYPEKDGRIIEIKNEDRLKNKVYYSMMPSNFY